MKIQAIEEIFKGFNDRKILIAGDVMLDSYWWGNVSRISPEAPVPVIALKDKEYRAGGAANVAMNIKMLGAEPVLVSICGEDAEGEIFREILKTSAMVDRFILPCKNRPTTVKSRIIANKQQQMLRVDYESDRPVDEEITRKLKDLASEALDDAHAVIIEDYDKGVLGPDLIKHIIEIARKKGIPTIVDPKKRNFFHYHHATLLKPNLKELREGLNISLERPFQLSQLREAADMLIASMNIDIAFITLSEDGIYVRSKTEEHLVPAHKRSIYDVSGAGDTVAAVAGLCMASGIKLPLMAELTNIAGGLVCENVGVVPIDKDRFFIESIRLLSDQ